jgi:hypothetical protein
MPSCPGSVGSPDAPTAERDDTWGVSSWPQRSSSSVTRLTVFPDSSYVPRITRRTVLCAAGSAVALPFLDAMLPQLVAALSTFKLWAKSAVEAAPRMICG